jgi:hypothetical protein
MLTGISIIRVLITSKFNRTIKKVKNVNEKIYILCNGPSLLNDLNDKVSCLSSYDLIVVNDMVKSKYYCKLKPLYYILADPAYWDVHVDPKLLDQTNIVLNKISEETNWKMNLVVPYEAYKSKRFRSFFVLNKNINIQFYNVTTFDGVDYIKYFFYRHNLAMPRPQNVLIACIFLAINLKYKEINLLGVDHSWIRNLSVNKKNEVCLRDYHFYDNQEVIETPFKTLYGDIYAMPDILRDFAKMFEGYHILKKFATIEETIVINRTKDSFIDAFEKREMD